MSMKKSRLSVTYYTKPQILNVLEERRVDSVDELIAKLKPELKKETKEYTNERARLSHHLKAIGNRLFDI